MVDTPPTLRKASIADAHAIAEVHVASWKRAYRGLLQGEFLDGLDVDQRALRYRFDDGGLSIWIATVEDTVVGLLIAGGSRDEDADRVGEIQALYVEPRRWRTGAGTLLLNKGEELLAAMGFGEATLWVLDTNERGRRFYEARGWVCEGTLHAFCLGGSDVTEIRYRKALT